MANNLGRRGNESSHDDVTTCAFEIRYDTVAHLVISFDSEVSVKKRPSEIQGLDERVRRSKTTVLDTTSQLLYERGLSGTSVDEIARRSGVAKTTIYRHWPTRVALLRDACSLIGTPFDTPDTGSLEGDVVALLTHLAHLLRSEKWTSVLPSVIDAAERDPDVAEMYRTLQAGYSAPLESVIRRAVTKRELPRSTDVALLVSALTGPLFYRRWFSREPLTARFAEQIARVVLQRRGNPR